MIRPEDLLRLAEALANGPAEPEWRSAVSRAYYAAFHAAGRLLRDLTFRVPRSGVAHGCLWMRLGNCGDAPIASAGSQLNMLQGLRNEADYDLHMPVSQADALSATQVARGILAALVTGHAQPVRGHITAAIRDYERNVLRVVTWQGP